MPTAMAVDHRLGEDGPMKCAAAGRRAPGERREPVIEQEDEHEEKEDGGGGEEKPVRQVRAPIYLTM